VGPPLHGGNSKAVTFDCPPPLHDYRVLFQYDLAVW